MMFLSWEVVYLRFWGFWGVLDIFSWRSDQGGEFIYGGRGGFEAIFVLLVPGGRLVGGIPSHEVPSPKVCVLLFPMWGCGGVIG